MTQFKNQEFSEAKPSPQQGNSNGPPKEPPRTTVAGAAENSDGEPGRSGGRVSLEQMQAIANAVIEEVPIDKNQIQIAVSTKGAAARSAVAKYYADGMTEENVQSVSKAKRAKAIIAEDIAVAAQQERRISKILRGIQPYLKKEGQVTPLTLLEKIMLWALGIGSGVLLFMGNNTTAQVLNATGIEGFQFYWRAVLFSGIPPFLAFALKCIGHVFESRPGRISYTTLIWVIGLILGGVWVVMFASLFPALGEQPSDFIKRLLEESDTHVRPAVSSAQFITVQMLAEAFLAAGCWLSMAGIMADHEPPVCEPNPTYQKVSADLQEWVHHRQRLEQIDADLDAKLDEFEKKKERVIAKALSEFDGELATAGHDEQKKSRLQAILRGSVALFASLLLQISTHANTSFIVGVSPNYALEDGKAVCGEVLQLVLEKAGPGDEVLVYDALNQRPIARFLVPETESSLANARVRSRGTRLAADIAGLKKYLMTERLHSPEMDAAIDAPQFLALAGSQLRKGWKAANIILVGSAIYSNPDNAAFDMRTAYPSDAHLTADQNESVFSTLHRKKLLNRVTVHWAYLHDSFANATHRERLQRFWTLYVSSQAGVLGTFAANVELAFQRACETAGLACMDAHRDASDTTIEMRSVLHRPAPATSERRQGSRRITSETFNEGLGAAMVKRVIEIPPLGIDEQGEKPKANETSIATNLKSIPQVVNHNLDGQSQETHEDLALLGRKGKAPTVTVTNLLAPITIIFTNIPSPVSRTIVTHPTVSPSIVVTNAFSPIVSPTASDVVPLPAPTPNTATNTPAHGSIKTMNTVPQFAGRFSIWIVWPDDNGYCQLYVKPRPSAEELSPDNKESGEGRFSHHDSNSVASQSVELFHPFDVRQVKAWVHRFRGGPIQGLVIINHEGRILEGFFSIPVSSQTHFDVSSRVNNPYWTEINIPKILGMESEDSSAARYSNAPSSGVAVPVIIPGSERP